MAAEKLRAIVGGGVVATSEGSGLLARFNRGEVTLDEYLDGRVSEAMLPFTGKLSADRLEWMRGMLREQLATDPVLSERLRQATGRDPEAE